MPPPPPTSLAYLYWAACQRSNLSCICDAGPWRCGGARLTFPPPVSTQLPSGSSLNIRHHYCFIFTFFSFISSTFLFFASLIPRCFVLIFFLFFTSFLSHFVLSLLLVFLFLIPFLLLSSSSKKLPFPLHYRRCSTYSIST